MWRQTDRFEDPFESWHIARVDRAFKARSVVPPSPGCRARTRRLRATLPRGEYPLSPLTLDIDMKIGQVAVVVLVVLPELSFCQLEIHWRAWAWMFGYLD